VLYCVWKERKNRLSGFINNIPQKQKPCKAEGQAGQLGYMLFFISDGI
jgi:hypothetical protein